MVEGKLSNGFEYKIEDKTLDNYELCELLSEFDENPAKIYKFAKILLGTTQYEELKKTCVKDDQTSANLMTESITELLNNTKPLKN